MKRRREAEQKLVQAEGNAAHWQRSLVVAEAQLERAEKRLGRAPGAIRGRVGFRAWSRRIVRVIALRARVARARRLLARAALQRKKFAPKAQLARKAERVRALAIAQREQLRATNRKGDREGRRMARMRERLAERHADRDRPVAADTLKPVAIAQRPLPADPLPAGLWAMSMALAEHERSEAEAHERRWASGPWLIAASALVRPLNSCHAVAAVVAGRPQHWTWLGVSRELQFAFECLHRMPMQIWPRGFASLMPDFARENVRHAELLLDHDAGRPTGAIERLRQMGPPDRSDVARMNEALGWPARFLEPASREIVCVNHGALWRAQGRSVARECDALLDYSLPEFFEAENRGHMIIARGLNR